MSPAAESASPSPLPKSPPWLPALAPLEPLALSRVAGMPPSSGRMPRSRRSPVAMGRATFPVVPLVPGQALNRHLVPASVHPPIGNT